MLSNDTYLRLKDTSVMLPLETNLRCVGICFLSYKNELLTENLGSVVARNFVEDDIISCEPMTKNYEDVYIV